MRIQHRDLNIELAEEDARIPIIEALLFGRSLPPPLPLPPPPPVPEPPPAPVVAAKTAVPPVPIPDRLRAFWVALHPGDRKELALLAEKPYRPTEIESALGLAQRQLMGQHSRINRWALRHHVRAWIVKRGRARAGRKYSLEPEIAVLIRALADGA